MNKTQLEQCEQEQIIGHRADNAYSSFIKAFIESKKNLLVSSFMQTPVSEIDTILEIKRTLYVLDALETEIKSVIDTGKMASQALNKEPMEKH